MHVSLNGMDRAAGTIPHNKGSGKMNCGASGLGLALHAEVKLKE